MVVDFHSHILPGMDDGSQSPEESLAMLRETGAQGICHIVATPHFDPHRDTPEDFLARRRACAAMLREAAGNREDLPQVHLGAEVRFFSGMAQSDCLPSLTIGQTSFLLIEMPHAPWSDSLYRELEEIHTCQGLIPVIAHVDRYIRPFQTHRIPEKLEALPVLVQANAGFFLKRTTRKMGLSMLRKGQIHLIGSDCHNLTTRRPNMGSARKIIQAGIGESAFVQIHRYEQKILGEVLLR